MAITWPSPCFSIVLLHLHQLKDLEEVLQDLWGGQADLEQQVRIRGDQVGARGCSEDHGSALGFRGAVMVRGGQGGSV